jgi:hypothetical protein
MLPPWPGEADYGERLEANPLQPGDVPPARFEPAEHAVLVGDTARTRHADRLEHDPAMHAVMLAAAARGAALFSGATLNEAQRRAELERLANADQGLERALRAALTGRDADLAGAPAETLWRELMLVETERILADAIAAAAPQQD